MSTTVNQLLSKAMSTTSEDEAIACLKMARKKGSEFESTESKTDLFNGKTAEYWYKQTYVYYDHARKYKSQYESLKKTFTDTHSRLMLHKYFTIPVIIGLAIISSFVLYFIGASSLATCILF